MGVELEIGCAACHNWMWLGSAKPDKWQGFQVGNEAFAEWLIAHAHHEVLSDALELWRDDGDQPSPWSHAPSSWREDARSLGVTMAGRVAGTTSPVACQVGGGTSNLM
jgi:hypothetical protein